MASRPLPIFKGEKMPVKYSILSSHADASPKSGTKTSVYPKGKSGKQVKSKAKKKY